MARFPLSESKVRLLARAIAVGLRENPQVFSHPPVAPGTMEGMVQMYDALRRQITQVKSELLTLLEEKDRVLAKLKREMKRSLRYAEEATDFDDVQLKLLGWSGRREKRSLTR
jgi:hypothetical protein